MGMFDYVTHPPLPCWRCKELVSGWQSKDADCGLEEISPTQVRNFYTNCDKCDAWNQYKVIATEYTLEPNHGSEWEQAQDGAM